MRRARVAGTGGRHEAVDVLPRHSTVTTARGCCWVTPDVRQAAGDGEPVVATARWQPHRYSGLTLRPDTAGNYTIFR